MTRPTRLAVLTYPGAQMSTVLGLADMFTVANRGLGRPAFELTQTPDPIPADVLILPPSLSPAGPAKPDRARTTALRAVHSNGTVLASVCAGAFPLAETGLLDGRRGTTHWALADRFAQRFPRVDLCPDRLLIDDGDIVTAGGLMAWTDLALRIVERFQGPGRMRALARHFLLDPAPREQSYYMRFTPRFDHGDASILNVQHWLQRHFAEPVTSSNLTEKAGMGYRTFLRRFQAATGETPKSYLQALRLTAAQDALESGTDPVATIAWRVGYADVPAFSTLFRSRVGLTPGQYRRRFGPQGASGNPG